MSLIILLLSSSVVHAHMGSTKYLHVDSTEAGASVVAELDPIDLAYEVDLENPDDPDTAALLARAADVRRWAEQVFVVRSDGGRCAPSAGELELVATRGAIRGPNAIQVPLVFDCPTPRTGLTLHDAGVFEADPQHEAVVRVGTHATILRRGRQEVAIGDSPDQTSTAVTFLEEGAIHLVTGYDHVLFLLSLLLVAGVVAAKKGVRKAALNVAGVVTGFTIGHSITLIAAALDVVSLPSQLVESSIAASIALVAAWNVWKPEEHRGVQWVAIGFGLIHGFGFSSVLRELVLPAEERVVALLSFNVGIELAQLAIVAIAIGPLAWAGRKHWYKPWVVRGGSAAIGLVGLYWLVERALGL
jgi:hypothetical protein